MPYAPGVQDISGQLRAAGIAQAGQAWSQAIGNIGKSVTDAMQTYKQNQYLTNQALGKFTAASQADPSLLRFLESGGEQQDPNAPKVPISPEVLKAYSNIKSGKSDVYDAGLLGTMADTWEKTKQQAVQTQLLQYKADEAKRAADFWKNLPTEEAAATGVKPVSVAPTGQMGAMGGQGIPAVALGRFGPPAGTQEAAGAGTVTRPTGAVTPIDIQNAARSLRGTPGVTGAQLAMTARQSAAQRVKEFESGGVYQGPQGRSLADAETAKRNSDPNLPYGKMFSTEYSEGGKGWYSRLVDRPETPQEAQIRKENEAQTADRVKAAGVTAASDLEAGKLARRNAVATERLTNLIESGQLQTGKGQNFLNAARGWAKSFGADIDENKLTASNEGVAYLARQVLPIYAEQKGAISQREQELYSSMEAAMDKNPAANLAILKVAGERIKTDRQLERNASDYNAGKIDWKDFNVRRQSILDAFDAKIPDLSRFSPSIGQPSATTPASATASRTRSYDPATGTLK